MDPGIPRSSAISDNYLSCTIFLGRPFAVFPFEHFDQGDARQPVHWSFAWVFAGNNASISRRTLFTDRLRP